MSSSDHPWTNGQTERVNQILEDVLRAYVSDKQFDWDIYLPLLEFAYNNRPHRGILVGRRYTHKHSILSFLTCGI